MRAPERTPAEPGLDDACLRAAERRDGTPRKRLETVHEAAPGRTAAAAAGALCGGGGAAQKHSPCLRVGTRASCAHPAPGVAGSTSRRSLGVPLSPGEGTTSLLLGLEDVIAAGSASRCSPTAGPRLGTPPWSPSKYPPPSPPERPEPPREAPAVPGRRQEGEPGTVPRTCGGTEVGGEDGEARPASPPAPVERGSAPKRRGTKCQSAIVPRRRERPRWQPRSPATRPRE